MFLSELFQPNIDEGVHDLASFKAIFMAGPPGAGKNTVIKKLGLNAAGMRLQDVDSTLAYLNKTHPEKARCPITSQKRSTYTPSRRSRSTYA